MACYQYNDNGSCKFGDNCKFSHGNDGEGGEDAGAEFGNFGRQGGGYSRPARAPYRSRGVCFSWQESKDCQYGDRCRFGHGEEDQQQPAGGNDFSGGYGGGYPPRRGPPRSRGLCFTFRDSGSCTWGDTCRFSHDLNAPQDGGDAVARAPGICYKFRDTGTCNFAETCRFSHEMAEESAIPSFDNLSLEEPVQQQQPVE